MELTVKNSSSKILVETRNFVSSFYENELNSDDYYTNDLTNNIIDLSQTISKESGLTSSESEITLIASYLLYPAFIKKDISTIRDFLSSQDYSETDKVIEVIDKVLNNEHPQSNIEEVLWDSHFSYLAHPTFLNTDAVFRAKSGTSFSDLEWYEISQKVFIQHSYYTEYGQQEFNESKDANYQKVLKFIKKLQKMQDTELEKMLKLDGNELKDLKKKLSKIENRPERGVETLYRLASKNLYTRLTMVDNKGNILISINAIIISITLGSVLSRLEEDPHLLLPIVLLLVTNLGSILFAILATRPPKTKGVFSINDITKSSANLLSFDNFFNMKREDYHQSMDHVANNADVLYSNITEDIFSMGKRLGTKYHYLRFSYNIFLYGLMISVLGFLLCHIMFEI